MRSLSELDIYASSQENANIYLIASEESVLEHERSNIDDLRIPIILDWIKVELELARNILKVRVKRTI
ncbi:hypothetical protein V1478_012718 [Vespula squamosa]|uniref:Uncharacterized protein n=1 Tax=Vespula squamosa TaxID=30214 RepID=A0ABD2A8R3_VESSQ